MPALHVKLSDIAMWPRSLSSGQAYSAGTISGSTEGRVKMKQATREADAELAGEKRRDRRAADDVTSVSDAQLSILSTDSMSVCASNSGKI